MSCLKQVRLGGKYFSWKTYFSGNLTCFLTNSTSFHTKVWCELNPCFLFKVFKCLTYLHFIVTSGRLFGAIPSLEQAFCTLKTTNDNKRHYSSCLALQPQRHYSSCLGCSAGSGPGSSDGKAEQPFRTWRRIQAITSPILSFLSFSYSIGRSLPRTTVIIYVFDEAG
jgi:hypothetical protein